MIAICKSVFNSKIDFTGNLSHTWSREWFISALPFSNLKILGEILFFQRIFNMIIISILDRENKYGHASSSFLKVTIFPSQKAYQNRALSLLSDGSEISFSIRGFRSPSPEPIYSSDGKRLNTREYRKRKELEESRHNAIQKMISLNPEYKPPPDYK